MRNMYSYSYSYANRHALRRADSRIRHFATALLVGLAIYGAVSGLQALHSVKISYCLEPKVCEVMAKAK